MQKLELWLKRSSLLYGRWWHLVGKRKKSKGAFKALSHCGLHFKFIYNVLFIFCFFCMLRYTNNLGEAKELGIKKSIASQLALGFVYLIAYASYGLGFWYGTILILGDYGYTIGDALVVSLPFEYTVKPWLESNLV